MIFFFLVIIHYLDILYRLREECEIFEIERLCISCQLHQLMPSIVTCLVAKRLGNRFADNHWELRDFTANLVASICKR